MTLVAEFCTEVFLIHAAAAHRPFAQADAGFRLVDGIVPSGAIEGLLGQPCIGNVGFSSNRLEDDDA
jgi:hypothetical protein